MDKKLIEKRNLLLSEAEGILSKSETETRAMTDDELKRYNEIVEEVERINKTLEARAASAAFTETKPAAASDGSEKREDVEMREFAQMIRTIKTGEETRDNGANFTYTGNSAIIPQSIANMVIKAVENRCPIFAGATKFHVKGTLKVPTYGATRDNDKITVGYTEDFQELEAHAGAFGSVDLTGYLIGALSLIGKSLLNSSDIDLTNFVINEMADKMAGFIEHELLIGTTGKCTGILSCTQKIVTASASAITMDDLIKLQAKVPQQYQSNAGWTMDPDSFTLIKQLKDGNGRYLIQDDVTQSFPYRMLGKPVFLSDNMPAIAAGALPILYGQYSGLGVNIRENISIEVLREKYTTQHAIGIYSYLEMDSKIINQQKMAVLQMKAS